MPKQIEKQIDIKENQIVMYCDIDTTDKEFKKGFEQYLN